MSGAIGVLDHLVEAAVAGGASDIHLEPRQNGARARIRRDGLLVELLSLDTAKAAALVQRIKAIAGLDVTERQKPQDGRFWRAVGAREVEFRVSILPAVFGESVVLRVLDRAVTGLSLGGLGADAATAEALSRLVERPHGLVLVAGPTGSGKTTTLYAVLSRIDRVRRKLMTVEDPIEYELDGAMQIEIAPRFEIGFGSAVRAILRQDPDVILVGEIRDPQTASAALEASLTGHLVLATLHAADSATALRRLIDLGVARELLLESVAALVTQRLLLRLCEACRRPLEPDAARQARLELGAPPEVAGELFDTGGCGRCAETGFRGRFGVFEIVEADAAAAARLVDDPAAAGSGLELRRQAVRAALEGRTSAAEVLRKLGPLR